MTNNDKFEKIKQRINDIIAKRTQKFAERDKIIDASQEKRDAIENINDEIIALDDELSAIGRELTSKKEKLNDEFKKITANNNNDNSDKKKLVNYEINGTKIQVNVTDANRGKLNYIVGEINLTNKILVFYEKDAKMSDEERLAYFDNLSTKISDQSKVTNPAKKVTFGNRYSIINACDEKLYLKCIEIMKQYLVAVETKKNDPKRIQAMKYIVNQQVKVEDVKISVNFRIDRDYVNTIESLEERAQYFNNLAIEISKGPKPNPKKVPLGNGKFAIVDELDEMLFKQCLEEWNKAKKEMAKRNKPSYTIDWQYVNSLKTAERRADYFEDLCSKINAVEKKDTVKIPFNGRTYIVNRVDKEVFETAIQEFEKNYLQFVKEKNQAEKARIEEEKRRQEEAERARIEEEKRKQEEAEKARIEEEKRKQEEAERARIEEEKREQEEAEKARIEEEKREKEKAKRIEVAQKVFDGLKASNTMAVLKARAMTDTTKLLPAIIYKTPLIEALSKDSENNLTNIDEAIGLSPEEKEDFLFIEEINKDVIERQLINEKFIKDDEATGIDEILNQIESSNPDFDDSEINFFDDDDEYEDEYEEQADDTKDKGNNIYDMAAQLGGKVTNINGFEIVDLNGEAEEKDKPDSKEKKKKKYKSFIFGKKKEKEALKTEEIDVYEDDEEEKTIEISDDKILKVLTSRQANEDISNSKLYTLQKEFYLGILDKYANKQIIDKVPIVTKRLTIEVDAKYADFCTHIANMYEKLEDKYEKIANDKYHKLKIASIFWLLIAVGGLALYPVVKDKFESNNAAKLSGIPNTITNITELNLNNFQNDDDVIQIIDESLQNGTNSNKDILESTISGNNFSYSFPGSNIKEAFEVSGSQLRDEDLNEDIIKEAQTNGKPLSQIVR